VLKVKEFLLQLKFHDVQFIIIGGQAAVLHGSAYLTADLDICYSRNKANLDKIVKALSPFHPVFRGAEEAPFVFDAKSLQMGLNFTFSTVK